MPAFTGLKKTGAVTLLEHLNFVRIRQVFPRPVIDDPYNKVLKEMKRINLGAKVKPGWRIAITAGSRGIKNIDTILGALVETVKITGAEPFVVGAMGSHGGGTADGQKAVLTSLGITQEKLGCPVLTSEEVVEIGATSDGTRVFCDINAWRADGIIVCNRIKPHTTFHGLVESGLMKMMAVGLGKTRGATCFHRLEPRRMARSLVEIGDVFARSGKIIGAIGIVENSYEDTAIIEAVSPDRLVEVEERLLIEAYRLMPRLPADKLDFLIVRQMGKNFSGTGMDTNVIGRLRMAGVPEPETPFVARIVVLDLSGASHGNATGVGLADITTRRLVDKMDSRITYLNCITSGNVQRAMLPVIMPDDRAAIEAAVSSLSADEPVNLKGAIINNTLELEHLWVTGNVADKLNGRSDIGIIGAPRRLTFNDGLMSLKEY